MNAPFDEEAIARALEAKGRPIAAALTRGFTPSKGRECEPKKPLPTAK